MSKVPLLFLCCALFIAIVSSVSAANRNFRYQRNFFYLYPESSYYQSYVQPYSYQPYSYYSPTYPYYNIYPNYTYRYFSRSPQYVGSYLYENYQPLYENYPYHRFGEENMNRPHGLYSNPYRMDSRNNPYFHFRNQ